MACLAKDRMGGNGQRDMRSAARAGLAATIALLAVTLASPARSATITVNTTADTGMLGGCSLRDAITAANSQSLINVCIAGSRKNDTIVFASGLTGSVALGSTLPTIVNGEKLTIQGPTGSAGITIDGGNVVQLMVVNRGATLNLRFLTLANGEVVNSLGGGILNEGTLTVTNSTFSGNDASGEGVGGGISNQGGTLTVTNSTFSGNSAFGFFVGGGIFNQGGTLTVTNSTFSGNSASSISVGGGCCGGGIYNEAGTLTVTNSTFSGNGSGGGILNEAGSLAVTNSTFSGNGSIAGGGINNEAGTLTVTNSTFSGNGSEVGGGIINEGTLTVTNSTFSGNSAAFGGGGIRGGGSLKGTILAASPYGGNCVGTIADAGYNISDDSSCGFSGTSKNNTNPMLDTAGLADKGGPTQTIALQSSSPAIDAIPVEDCTDQASPAPNPITTDQRGALRPDAGEVFCDIGAYEFQDLARQPNCNGLSDSALSREFGTLAAAASAYKFPSVKALKNAIAEFCGG